MKFLKIVRFVEIKDDHDPLADFDSKEMKNIENAIENAIEDAFEEQGGCLGYDGNGNARIYLGMSSYIEVDENAEDVESAISYPDVAENAIRALHMVHASVRLRS